MPARLKLPLAVLINLLLFGVLWTPIFSADIVINEFLADLPSDQNEDVEEWVELYNQGSTTIDLTGWVLKDSIDTHQLVISGLSMAPHSFTVIKRNGSSFSLNNSSDQVRLFNATQSGILIDSFTYSSVTENRSWGRIPDGSGSFINDLDPSPGKANLAPTPEPASSSTSSDSTSTSTPTPTSGPTSTPTPTPTGQVAGLETSEFDFSSTFSAFLTIGDVIEGSTPSADPATSSSILGSHPSFTPWIIAIGGFSVLGSVAPFLLKRYNISIWKPKSKDSYTSGDRSSSGPE